MWRRILVAPLALAGLAGGQPGTSSSDRAVVTGSITITIAEKRRESRDMGGYSDRFEHDKSMVFTYQMDGLPQQDDRLWSGSVPFSAEVTSRDASETLGSTYHAESHANGTGATDLEVETYRNGDSGPLFYQFNLSAGPLISGPEHQVTSYKATFCPSGGEAPCTDQRDDSRSWSSGGAQIRDERFDGRTATASGSRTITSSDGATVKTIRWTLRIGKPMDVEAVIVPEATYATWLPTLREKTRLSWGKPAIPGLALGATVKVRKKSDPTQPLEARFRFELVDVSREKGECLNYPPSEAKTNPDLLIDKDRNTGLKVQCEVASDAAGCAGLVATTEDLRPQATVWISPYDWGGWGQLKVTAILGDETEVPAHVDGFPTRDALQIPLDENGNHIADFWEKSNAASTSTAKEDNDSQPKGDDDVGDGLSLYEEYRGFLVQMAHIRTSPVQSDVFIEDASDLHVGYFPKSKLAIHLVGGGEYAHEEGATNERVINPNRGFATLGPEHVLYLLNKNMPGLYGEAEGDGPGPPGTCRVVGINKKACTAKGVSKQELPSTIAHELAHASNVWHHGDGDYRIETWKRRVRGVLTAYRSEVPIGVAVEGGVYSGVEECIMRYEGTSFYETPYGSFLLPKQTQGLVKNVKGEPYGPFEEPGTLFCKQKPGTGVNDEQAVGGPKAGDATEGSCETQFCVNDRKQHPRKVHPPKELPRQ